MVGLGLSILLESQKNLEKSSQVINKSSMIKSPLSPSSSSPSFYSSSPLPAITFLDACFLCKQELLPGKDIYMYKGDRAFCSIECRCRQIFMDEESVRKENCSFVVMKPKSSASSSQHRKRSKNRAGGFAF